MHRAGKETPVMMLSYYKLYLVYVMGKGMSYKKFREKEAEYYTSNQGRLSRAEVIKKLESFIVQKQGEGQDFFNKYEVKEEH
ncbi:MAG: hypothetical protein KGI25_06840 [Thaumarchaeota archaeon]|nr:hypothetical protein [Nitrososphaerota archaeon]